MSSTTYSQMGFTSELAEENQHSWKAAGRSGRKRGTTWRSAASPPNRSRPPSSSPQEPKHADWGRVPGAGGISCQTPATRPSCHIWGDDPFRGHCLLGLGSDSGRPEMELGARDFYSKHSCEGSVPWDTRKPGGTTLGQRPRHPSGSPLRN